MNITRYPHKTIIERMQQLNYKYNTKGVCAGIAPMWTQAILSCKEYNFNRRIEFICITDFFRKMRIDNESKLLRKELKMRYVT